MKVTNFHIKHNIILFKTKQKIKKKMKSLPLFLDEKCYTYDILPFKWDIFHTSLIVKMYLKITLQNYQGVNGNLS